MAASSIESRIELQLPTMIQSDTSDSPRRVVKLKKRRFDDQRDNWSSSWQFMLTSLGCAIGLGNIWRFPSKAYENGGGAFLIPYIFWCVVFGVPVVYGEFIIGQFTGSSAGRAFSLYAPAFQGIGWAMALQEIFISSYYMIIITWGAIYFAVTLWGDSYVWNDCENIWNSDYCVSASDYKLCSSVNNTMRFYDPLIMNCVEKPVNNTIHSTLEYFENVLTKRSTGLLDINEMNWTMLFYLMIAWILFAFILIKGINLVGYMSYVILSMFLIYGVTLPNSSKGIRYFLMPQWSALFRYEAWAEALQQLAFSLTIGTGAHISVASFNRLGSNCYKAALFVVIGDTIISLIAGIATFGFIGYLSQQTGKPIEDLSKGGTSLAFSVYLEAMNMMNGRWIMQLLFFLTILFLGISSQIIHVQTVATFFIDQFDFCRRNKWLPNVALCFFFFLIGTVMCTDAGWYWFNLHDEFAGSMSRTLIIALEFIVIAGIYGRKKIEADLRVMWEEPKQKKNHLARWWSRHSPWWLLSWSFFVPALSIIICFLLCWQALNNFTIDVYDKKYVYPIWAMVYGWLMTIGPLLAIPIVFCLVAYQNYKEGNTFKQIFACHPKLYHRAQKYSGSFQLEEKFEKAEKSQ